MMRIMNNMTFTERCREYVRLHNEMVSPWEEMDGRLFRQTENQDWIDLFEIMSCVISLNKWLKDHGKQPLAFKVVTQEWWDMKDGQPFQLYKRKRYIIMETSYLECVNDRIDEKLVCCPCKRHTPTSK